MRDTNLVNALRAHAEWARANVLEAPEGTIAGACGRTLLVS